MQPPTKIQPTRLADYLDIMGKSMFQSGISWRVVESKWPGMREALHEFDVETIANLGEPDLEQLVLDQRIIRSRRKLDALAHNARRMLELEQGHGTFTNYLRSHGGFEATMKDIRQQFKYLGDSGAYHFLYVVGEAVPPYEEHCASH